MASMKFMKAQLEKASDAELCFRLRERRRPDEYSIEIPAYTYEEGENGQVNVRFKTEEELAADRALVAEMREEEERTRRTEVNLVQEILIERHNGLIRSQTLKYSGVSRKSSYVDEDDLYQIACMAFLDAASRFHEGFQCSNFQAYATGAIKNALYREYTENSGDVKIPASTKARHDREGGDGFGNNWEGESLDIRYEGSGDQGASPAENKMAAQGKVAASAEDEAFVGIDMEMKRQVTAKIHEILSDRQLDMLYRHHNKGENYVTIAKEYGITRQTVRTVIMRAEKRLLDDKSLRKACREAGILR